MRLAPRFANATTAPVATATARSHRTGGGAPRLLRPDPADRASARSAIPPTTSPPCPRANLGLGCGNPKAIAGLRRARSCSISAPAVASTASWRRARWARKAGYSASTGPPHGRARARQRDQRRTQATWSSGSARSRPSRGRRDRRRRHLQLRRQPRHDKAAVFRDALRVLKPGGRLAISDRGARELPAAVVDDLAARCGCISGAARSTSDLVAPRVGFGDDRDEIQPQSREIIAGWGRVRRLGPSARINAMKPGGACCGPGCCGWARGSSCAAELHPFVARRVPPADVEDVLQDVFLRLQRGLPALRADGALVGWLLTRSLQRSRPSPAARCERSKSPTMRSPCELEIRRRGVPATCAVARGRSLACLASPYREAIPAGRARWPVRRSRRLRGSACRSRRWLSCGCAQLRQWPSSDVARSTWTPVGHVVEVTPRVRCACAVC